MAEHLSPPFKGLAVYACIAVAVHSFLVYGMLVVQDAGPARSFPYTRLFSVDLSGQTLVSEKGVEGTPWVDLHGARLEGAYKSMSPATPIPQLGSS